MPRILVVDDEAAIARSIERALLRRGFEVRVARSGAQALTLLDEVDVVLADAFMPGMSGIELATEVKRQRPDVICLLMSGDAATVRAVHPAIDASMLKPFAVPELIERIRCFLDARAAAAQGPA